MGVFDLPYMFTNYEDCYKLIDQNWDEINKRMIAESGNMAVGWLVPGLPRAQQQQASYQYH